ncbi:MAG: hypothetical protein OCC49_18170 [Fibrobacterales bacterium]
MKNNPFTHSNSFGYSEIAKYRLLTVYCILVTLIVCPSVLAGTTIEANTEGADSYYYSLRPTNNCSGATLESGWVSTDSWTYPGELPSNCIYQATVWTNNDMKNADKSYEIGTTSTTNSTFANSTGQSSYMAGTTSLTSSTTTTSTTNSTSTTTSISTYSSGQSSRISAMAFSVYSMLPDDEFMGTMFPKDLQDDYDTLMANYPGIEPKANAAILSTADFDESTDKMVITNDDYFDWWCVGRRGWSVVQYKTICKLFTRQITLDEPDEPALSNYNNTELEPGVKNLLLFPGTSNEFDYDWSQSGPSLTSYPLSKAYLVKGFAYMAVPVTGYYNFASQTTGGVKAEIVKSDGQEVSLLQESSWELNVDKKACESSNELSYKIKKRVKEYSIVGVNTIVNKETWIIKDKNGKEFDDDDNGINWVLYNLAGVGCSNSGAQSNWGDDVYLEAGKVYPLRVSMWAGWNSAQLKLMVKMGDGTSRALPMSWLSAPNMDNFDTENGWHGALESPASIPDSNDATIGSAVAGGYNYWGGYAPAAITTIDSEASVINISMYTDSSNGWTQRGSLDVSYSGDIDQLDSRFSSATDSRYAYWGDRLVIVTDASLMVVNTSDPDNLSYVNVSLGNIVPTGALSLIYDGDMGGRLAVGADDGIHFFDWNNGTWTATSTIANVSLSPDMNGALVFNPNSMETLYVALNSGRVQRYDYSSNSWTASNFDATGNSVAISNTGQTMAIVQDTGIAIYTTSGGESLVTTIIPPSITEESPLITLDDFTLVAQGSDELYVYTHSGTDWNELDPNWRTIELDDSDGTNGSWLWIAPSGMGGGSTIGVFPTTNIALAQLYYLIPDELLTLNGELVEVTITNISDQTIPTTQLDIYSNDSSSYVFWKGETPFYTNDFYKWTINNDAASIEMTNIFSSYLMSGTNIEIDVVDFLGFPDTNSVLELDFQMQYYNGNKDELGVPSKALTCADDEVFEFRRVIEDDGTMSFEIDGMFLYNIYDEISGVDVCDEVDSFLKYYSDYMKYTGIKGITVKDNGDYDFSNAVVHFKLKSWSYGTIELSYPISMDVVENDSGQISLLGVYYIEAKNFHYVGEAHASGFDVPVIVSFRQSED